MTLFCSPVKTTDASGRAVRDEIGLPGKGKAAMRVRRITLPNRWARV